MFIKTVLPIFLIIFLLDTSETQIVNTKYGQISGKLMKTINNTDFYGFMGIPYAAPPIGEKRFLPPHPIDPWPEILNADKEKQPCIQYNTNVKKGQPMGIHGSEDCLYLDIFTRKLNDIKPVVVFLYNENFRNSHNKSKDYAPDYFVEESLTVVTISHRLSVFGFLSLENDKVSGNAGLKDIVAGLEWIQENISNFGGDKDKVTLMGVNGGAAAVDFLLNSDFNFLFHSAILQSGTSLSSKYLQDHPKDRALKLAELLGIQTDKTDVLLKELRSINPSEILEKEFNAVVEDYFKNEQKSLLPFGPVMENNFAGLITKDTLNNYDQIDIPIMIGFNSQEGLESSLQYLIEPRYLSVIEKDFPLLMPRRIKFKFDPFDEMFYEAVEDIKKFYFAKEAPSRDLISDYITYISDVLTSFAVDYSARLFSQRSKRPVFYYLFDYSTELNENKINLLKLSSVKESWGTASGDELCYLFKCPDLIAEYSKLNRTSLAVAVAQRKIVTMWANFVKYGNPTPDEMFQEGPKWLPFDIKTRNYLHISDNLEMKSKLYDERFEFWNSFLEKWEHRVNGIVNIIHEIKKDEL